MQRMQSSSVQRKNARRVLLGSDQSPVSPDRASCFPLWLTSGILWENPQAGDRQPPLIPMVFIGDTISAAGVHTLRTSAHTHSSTWNHDTWPQTQQI